MPNIHRSNIDIRLFNSYVTAPRNVIEGKSYWVILDENEAPVGALLGIRMSVFNDSSLTAAFEKAPLMSWKDFLSQVKEIGETTLMITYYGVLRMVFMPPSQFGALGIPTSYAALVASPQNSGTDKSPIAAA